MMKKSILLLPLLALSACVQLTPAGAQVKILTADQAALVATCHSLGSVSVSSEDALRNITATLSGDTAIIKHRDVSSASIIDGDLYRCAIPDKNIAPGNTPDTSPKPIGEEKTNGEYLRKSNLCHAKGGTWISNQCIIQIE